MHLLRSSLFAVLLAVITVPYAVLAILIFWLPPMTRHRLITSWVPLMMWVIRHVLGIRYRVIGAQNIPPGPAVILSKHQSAWETIALQQIFPPLCYVLKRELLRVPFFGWALGRIPGIAIDRAAGKDALSQVVEQGRKRLHEGLWVAVFPEGTRVAPGVVRRYKPGGAILAKRAGVPVVPVAHNAGEFWRRNAFVKRPGEIIVSIGPLIEVKGVKAEEINRRAEEWIEGEMRRLFGHHYAGAQSKPEAAARVPD
ncbi:lysophospholipid acyltransferase family protein [Thauera aromatica]|uniref:1-acyl-sn-glycerol-3-phosphate acyltransferase n=1 Tax=Thauera aromatica K172 TaxID=44139 RepID=A0A2R4BJR1_THAAR|nr:lysophospholipid acyltransferase family protein [Thauera aromatica]AVR87551.1 1-acyl-sn-glycerol-3-phosphate acyltransferase [Thauera aromatica K172]MCK2096387.1 1-acyl-sn-glycerol-3-phosphate acyltransferase [Thauera aromatica]